MSKYIRFGARSLSDQIAHEIDKDILKNLKESLPLIEIPSMELSLHTSVFGPVLIGSTDTLLQAVEFGSDVDKCYINFMNKWNKYNEQFSVRTNMDIVDRVLDSINTGNIDPLIILNYSWYGTWFQKQVWNQLRKIPAGSTMSYQEIAKAIGRGQSGCAIGKACETNPISFFIPCYRAIKTNAKFNRVNWREDLKKKLRDRESI